MAVETLSSGIMSSGAIETLSGGIMGSGAIETLSGGIMSSGEKGLHHQEDTLKA